MELLDKIDKLIPESVYGKEKSKAWFKLRGLIASVKNSGEMTKILKQLEQTFKKGQINQFEMTDLTNQALEKANRI